MRRFGKGARAASAKAAKAAADGRPGAPNWTDGLPRLRDPYHLLDRFLCLRLPSGVGFGVGRSPSVEGRTRG
jgi:hypothetical protein